MTIVLSLALAGGAIDFGRWLSAKSKTLNAIDASILAGGRVLQLSGKTNADAVTAATLYYSKNKTNSLTTDNTSFSVNNNEITGTTTSTIETPFLKVVGIDSLPVNVTAKAVLAAGSNAGSHIEVSMMLDTTGSMWGSKMVDLKAAAKDLIDIVVWEDQSTYQARVALAPFSYFVNVGSTYYSAVTGRSASGSTNQRTCVAERRTSDRYTDAPPSSGRSASGSTNQRTCVAERRTSDRYTDAPPSSGNYFSYYSGSSTCRPTSTIMPLSSDKDALKSHIDAMPTSGVTAGHLGTAWAWYLISPNWSSVWPTGSQPMAYSLMSENVDPDSSAVLGDEDFKPKLHKIAVLMTDGSYNRSYHGSSSTTQAREICDSIKATGITVYAVGFRIGVGSTPDVTMQLCATSPSHYYNASSGEALKQAFRDIAIKISELRISE